MPATPVFSFVATSRNDDHGGDVLRRTQTFINRLAEQCTRHQVSAELVLVDWNPPPARAPLADVLAWPAGSEWFSARVVIVPPALHHEFAFSRRLGMFQMIAKNVGIRHARGEYMIATNIDIVFSDALFGWLKSQAMRAGVLYRSDRWDIPNAIQLEAELDVLLARAEREHIRRNMFDGTYIRRDGEFVNNYGLRVDHVILYPMEGILTRLKVAIQDQQSFDRDGAVRAIDAIMAKDLPLLRRTYLIPPLHTNGCGDFTMMTRQDWFALRGYPEWHVFSWNIDSIIVFQAHYNGMAVEVLDPGCVHYHVEHDYGSGWTPEGADSLWSRLTELGLPFVGYQEFYDLIYALQDSAAEHRFALYNDADWGFGDRELECRVLAEPGSPARPPHAVNQGKLDENFLKQLIPVVPQIRLEDGERSVPDVEVERHTAADGEAELAIRSLAATWSYAFQYALLPLNLEHGEYWIRVQLVVDEGNVVVGVLNHDQTDFLCQLPCRAAPDQVQQVFAHIADIDKASELVFRNTTPDNRPARFRVRSIQLLREDTTEDDAILARAPEVALKRQAGLTLALRHGDDAPRPPAAAPEPEPVSSAPPLGLSGEADLSALAIGAPGAVIRLLGEVTPEAGAGVPGVQALILTPAEPWAEAAILDLSGARAGAGTIRVQLQVIEGEAKVRVHRKQIREPVADHSLSVTPPFTEVTIDVNGFSDLERLVIANGPHAGRTKVLLHRVDYHPN